MILHPRSQMLVVGKNEVCADRYGQNPVIGLNNEDLSHEAVEIAERGLLGSLDVVFVDIHGCRE